MTENSPQRLCLTLTPEQASAVCAALDLYMRLGIGQVEEVAELMRLGTLPRYRATSGGKARQQVDTSTIEEVESHLMAIKALVGFPASGSHGVGHADNDPSVNRSYEVLKVLQQAVSQARNPERTFRGVDTDGLTVRYTSDPRPECEVMVSVPTLATTTPGHKKPNQAYISHHVLKR